MNTDEFAKAYWANLEIEWPPTTWYPILPTSRKEVYVTDNTLLCRYLTKTLYDCTLAADTQEYWYNRNKIRKDIFNDIDCASLHKTMKLSTVSSWIWIVKHSMGNCGVNSVLKRRKQKETDECPRCGGYKNATHVWICPNLKAVNLWETSLDTLETRLHTSTSATLTSLLITYFRHWHNGTIPTTIPNAHTTALQQHTIG
jgi:hypothetical protein